MTWFSQRGGRDWHCLKTVHSRLFSRIFIGSLIRQSREGWTPAQNGRPDRVVGGDQIPPTTPSKPNPTRLPACFALAFSCACVNREAVISLHCLSPCPHSAGEILKHSFIFPVRPTVHTNPSRERSFSKAFFKLEEFENAGFAL